MKIRAKLRGAFKIPCNNSHLVEHNKTKKMGLDSISFKIRLCLVLV